jgi:hypothetical protein
MVYRNNDDNAKDYIFFNTEDIKRKVLINSIKNRIDIKSLAPKA